MLYDSKRMSSHHQIVPLRTQREISSDSIQRYLKIVISLHENHIGQQWNGFIDREVDKSGRKLSIK